MREKNRVLIVGDAMLDTYIYGDVSRVSPEAPVPVVSSFREGYCLGGASNVARNAAALGACVSVLFAIGDDSEGTKLKSLLLESNIICDYMFQDSSLHTINKMRIVGNNQQIVRVDFHDQYCMSEEVYERLIAKLRIAIQDKDVVVISDYGKGLCTEQVCREVISLSRKQGIPVIVDPKGIEWKKYRGASIITPNLKELNVFCGQNILNDSFEIQESYSELYRELGIDHLLLTRSECGVSLMGKKGTVHLAAKAHKVYDVSGAGDTVVATIAALLSSHMENILEAVELANIAAGIVVAKPGTAIVTLEEIQEYISGMETDQLEKKIYHIENYNELKKKILLWRMAGDQIVTTNGCFDLLHKGHVKLLEQARQMGNRLIVGLNSDESVKRLKGRQRPINKEMDRAYVISALNAVDAVAIFDSKKTPYFLTKQEKEKISNDAFEKAGEAPMSLMKMIQPDIHVKGGDYQEGQLPEALFAKRVAVIKLEDGYSTTNVVNKMADCVGQALNTRKDVEVDQCE